MKHTSFVSGDSRDKNEFKRPSYLARPHRISEDNCITNILPSPLINIANPISLQNLYVINQFLLN